MQTRTSAKNEISLWNESRSRCEDEISTARLEISHPVFSWNDERLEKKSTTRQIWRARSSLSAQLAPSHEGLNCGEDWIVGGRERTREKERWQSVLSRAKDGARKQDSHPCERGSKSIRGIYRNKAARRCRSTRVGAIMRRMIPLSAADFPISYNVALCGEERRRIQRKDKPRATEEVLD